MSAESAPQRPADVTPDSTLAQTYDALQFAIAPGANVAESPLRRPEMQYQGDPAPEVKIKSPGEPVKFKGYTGPTEDSLGVTVTNSVLPKDEAAGRPESNAVEYSVGNRNGTVGVKRRTYNPETGEYVGATVTELTGKRAERAKEILTKRVAGKAGKAITKHYAALNDSFEDL